MLWSNLPTQHNVIQPLNHLFFLYVLLLASSLAVKGICKSLCIPGKHPSNFLIQAAGQYSP